MEPACSAIPKFGRVVGVHGILMAGRTGPIRSCYLKFEAVDFEEGVGDETKTRIIFPEAILSSPPVAVGENELATHQSSVGVRTCEA